MSSFHNKNRTSCSPNDRFCNTTKHETLKAATSMSPHHDQIGHHAFRLIKNDLNGIPRRKNFYR